MLPQLSRRDNWVKTVIFFEKNFVIRPSRQVLKQPEIVAVPVSRKEPSSFELFICPQSFVPKNTVK